MTVLSYLYWDPHPEMFPIELPFLHRGILWYGFFFALGFFVGYWVFLHLLRRNLGKGEHKRSLQIAEKVTLYAALGTLIGARLGDVLFYQSWAEIARHPLSIFKIWEGGLASHGGAIGIILALWLVSKKVKISFLRLLDLCAVSAAIIGVFIRVGNFFNQEILGTPTTLPWGVIFGHPVGASQVVPRHPVQLYEALWYALVFVILLCAFKKNPHLHRPGRIAGLCLVLIFSFRFLIEWVKVEQSQWYGQHYLTMGQWLSIPMILAGIYLLCRRVIPFSKNSV